jgi:hypothetical protein
MEHSTIIKSAHDGTTFEFSDRAGVYYRVSLSGPDIHGACRVYDDEPGTQPDKFFRDLAANWRGWQGKKEWSSLEGELRFSATCDSTGHTSLSVQLRSGPYPFDWSLSAVLLIEAGALERIASEIEKFVGQGCAS